MDSINLINKMLNLSKKRRNSLLDKNTAEKVMKSFASIDEPKSNYEHKLEEEIEDWTKLISDIVKEKNESQIECDESILLPEQKEYIKKGFDLQQEYLIGVEPAIKTYKYYHSQRQYLEETKQHISANCSGIVSAKVSEAWENLH